LGFILISDVVKEEAKETLKELKDNGIKELVMLTGDHEIVAQNVANQIDIDTHYSELLPNDKLDLVEKHINENKKVAFVGDGVNDAPVLARADVGIAMGKIGQDIAIEASDVVIMDDNISKIPKAISLAKKTMRVVYENIYFSIFVKVLVLILSAFKITNMWIAVFADVGVCLIAILNALRAGKLSNKKKN
nr:HAD-IC family P-type ATPase [Clostridia bacterium]